VPETNLMQEIQEVQEWIIYAGKALAVFYDSEEGIFYRNSQKITEKIPEGKKSKFPTSTNRSFFAMFEYLRFLNENDLEGDAVSGDVDAIGKMLKGVVESYFSLKPRAMRWSKTNKINIFTDGHLLLSVGCIKTLHRYRSDINVNLDKLKRSLSHTASDAVQGILKNKGGRMGEQQETHDFITLHVVRGIDAFDRSLLSDEKVKDLVKDLRERVKETVLRSLAYDFAHVSSKFDPVELTFSIALLNRLGASDIVQITNQAVESIVSSQAPDGGWPATRLISYEAPNYVHIASYEVSLALADLLIRKLYQGDESFFDLVFEALRKSFALVKSHYTTYDQASGWVNDHTRKGGLVESWATAIVLTFLIHYHDALQLLLQQRILAKYQPIVDIRYKSGAKESCWPDMIPALREDSIIEPEIINQISDPSQDHKIRDGIVKHLLEPIEKSWIHRPQSASMILYGPPGTRKTSMAIGIGKAIRWPIILLSPPQFLRKGGLEGFEASADEIFFDLSRLRRVVVLFDECEEFFKNRVNNDHPSSRTLGAFITSGMLPRLHMLREKRWCLFILGTNSGLNELDEAVRRQGRFDFVEEINHPVLSAQLSYLSRKSLEKDIQEIISSALCRHNENLSHEEPPVSFSVIDELIGEAKKQQKENGKLDISSLIGILTNLLASPGPKRLIT